LILGIFSFLLCDRDLPLHMPFLDDLVYFLVWCTIPHFQPLLIWIPSGLNLKMVSWSFKISNPFIFLDYFNWNPPKIGFLLLHVFQ
jgi:hypothetical protein